jgi:alpha-pyrone synthase
MSFSILGIGTAAPSTIVDRKDALGLARALCPRTAETSWLPSMYGNSGVNRRHVALGRDAMDDLLNGTRHSGSPFLPGSAPDDRGPTTAERMRHYAEFAPPLATEAARAGLDCSGLAPRDVSHLITVSCTGFLAPGLDWALVRSLGLAPTVQRTHIGFMGCHGALNGLRVAQAFAESSPEARVLLCAVELCSLHYHYGWNPQKLITNALFADGAAAVVGCAPGPGTAETWKVTATGSCLLPDSANAMTWDIGDHGFEMTLSRGLPELISRNLGPWLEGWLERQGLRIGDVGSWAVHPGGPAILQAVENALVLPHAALATSRSVLEEYGNMSSPTVLFILDRLRAAGAKLPCVVLGFGPGVVAEVALLRP